MTYYKTLPTTNHEVTELFHNLGYSDKTKHLCVAYC